MTTKGSGLLFHKREMSESFCGRIATSLQKKQTTIFFFKSTCHPIWQLLRRNQPLFRCESWGAIMCDQRKLQSTSSKGWASIWSAKTYWERMFSANRWNFKRHFKAFWWGRDVLWVHASICTCKWSKWVANTSVAFAWMQRVCKLVFEGFDSYQCGMLIYRFMGYDGSTLQNCNLQALTHFFSTMWAKAAVKCILHRKRESVCFVSEKRQGIKRYFWANFVILVTFHIYGCI